MKYIQRKVIEKLPRLPLQGTLDLTYRCNNNCRHCWICFPENGFDDSGELSFDELRRIVGEARLMGTHKWNISGGEPMIRADFEDIFDFLTRTASSYSLNTNGTFITPRIAQLMKRRGNKMVALYGATATVHDGITRRPGSFDSALRGMTYLQEASAGFTVQLVPLADNYHQWQEMLGLGKSLSPRVRCGASWLFLSASGELVRNEEIRRQRLPPAEVVALDSPDVSGDGALEQGVDHRCQGIVDEERLYFSCIQNRSEFYIDPYGMASFCSYVKDPTLRYDLRRGSFPVFWNDILPSMVEHVVANQEYREQCGACDYRQDCRWCPAYAYLECGRPTAKIAYLCEVAKKSRDFKENWKNNHRRFYTIADITIQVDADLPIRDDTYDCKFNTFRVDKPGADVVALHHHFTLPELDVGKEGQEIYRKSPWAIYRQGTSWIYKDISLEVENLKSHQIAVFNHEHSRGRIYNYNPEKFLSGNQESLTLFPSDQILIARLLADRQGCYLHSAGVILDDQGLLFAGHSEAGKSTITRMLQDHAEILCDDRNIVRQGPDGFRVYGTWSHGDVSLVSNNSAPLRGILFLEQSRENRIVPLTDNKVIVSKLLAFLIRPFVTRDWWEKTLTLLENVKATVPCYILHFDKSGRIVDILKDYKFQK